MKRRTTLILIAVILANVVVFVSLRHWRAQKQTQVDEMIRHTERYTGATGDTITLFENRTDRWLEEMRGESIEIVLRKLTDAAEYIIPGPGGLDFRSYALEELRERTFFSWDIEALLSNRRFRKAIEDLKKIDKKKAANLLSEHIRNQLKELRTELKKERDTLAQDLHKGNFGTVFVIPDTNSYRYSSHPDYPPTRLGRRYAVLSYILLASLLELQEVRPAIEEVVGFAKEEYRFFNSVDDKEAVSFKTAILEGSLYTPSLLVTAALCDPTWNTDKRQRLDAKLVEREIVDYQARAIEHDKDAKEGWIPVVPHDSMLKVRYYKGITDEEFTDFFGK